MKFYLYFFISLIALFCAGCGGGKSPKVVAKEKTNEIELAGISEKVSCPVGDTYKIAQTSFDVRMAKVDGILAEFPLEVALDSVFKYYQILNSINRNADITSNSQLGEDVNSILESGNRLMTFRDYALFCAFILYDTDEFMAEAISNAIYNRFRGADDYIIPIVDVLGKLSVDNREKILDTSLYFLLFEAFCDNTDGYLGGLKVLEESCADFLKLCRKANISIEATDSCYIIDGIEYSM